MCMYVCMYQTLVMAARIHSHFCLKEGHFSQGKVNIPVYYLDSWSGVADGCGHGQVVGVGVVR